MREDFDDDELFDDELFDDDPRPEPTRRQRLTRALLQIPVVGSARRGYYKAAGRARCIAAILRGDAVIFGATVRGATVEAGNTFLNVGIGDLTVMESTIVECRVTATGTRLGYGDKIVGNYFYRPDEPERTGDAIRVS